MTLIPLNQIGLRLRDHKSALYWLGLIYRRSMEYESVANTIKYPGQIKIGFSLWVHFLPYMALIILFGRLLLFEILHLPKEQAVQGFSNTMLFHLLWLAVGLGISLIIGLCVGFLRWLSVALAVGFAVGINGGLGVTFSSGFLYGLGIGLSFGFSLGFTSILSKGLGDGFSGIISIGLCMGVGIGLSMGYEAGIGFLLSYLFLSLRLFYFLIHPFFLWPKVHGEWYTHHPVAWDDVCTIPFFGLDCLLVSYAAHEPENALQEIERLINGYPSQRANACRAKAILAASKTRIIIDMSSLINIKTRLPEGEEELLNEAAAARE